jgi:hypothetical protein
VSITYALSKKDDLTADSDNYLAVVQFSGTVAFDDLVERMLQSNTQLSRNDVLRVLETYHTTIETMLLEGKTVNTSHAIYGVNITGEFKGPLDDYDPNRHRITATISPGQRLLATIRERAQAIKQEQGIFQPEPKEFIDLFTGAHNSILSPGGMAQLLGQQLKFDPLDTFQGVYFINARGLETRVDVVGRNSAGELRFMVPIGLAAGDHTLEVRAALPGTRERRTGVLATPLTVARETQSRR